MSIPWIPHEYQKRVLKFAVSRLCAALFLTPGLGKTAIMYALLAVFKRKKLLKGAVVVAPRRPAVSVWTNEAEKWTDFEHLDVCLLHGPHKGRSVLERHDVYILTYEGFIWLIEEGHLHRMVKAGWVNVLIFDELSKMKNAKSVRFKTIKKILHLFEYRYGLTGSPASNGLMGLFGQIYSLDMGKALGQYITHYRASFFTPVGDRDFPTWVPQAGAEEIIYARLKNVAIRVDARDHLKLPKLIRNVIKVDMPPAARKVYDQLENEMLAVFDQGPKAPKKIVAAATASAVSGKLHQMANGAVYDNPVDPETGIPRAGARTWNLVHDEKLDALEDLIEELQGQQLLVAYWFGHDLERILKRLGKTTPFIGSQTSDKQALAYEKAWNAGEIPVLLGQPASMGHGMNLQGSSAFNVCWFDNTFDFELFDQFNSRLERQGNKAETMFVHQIVARDTVDEAILAAQSSKKRGQDALHDALNVYRNKRRK